MEVFDSLFYLRNTIKIIDECFFFIWGDWCESAMLGWVKKGRSELTLRMIILFEFIVEDDYSSIPPGGPWNPLPCKVFRGRHNLQVSQVWNNTRTVGHPKKHRAVVLKRDGALAKVYYLDYGNSESLSLGSIFSMPPGQLATQMLSIRCRSVMITSIIMSFQFCCRYLWLCQWW